MIDVDEPIFNFNGFIWKSNASFDIFFSVFVRGFKDDDIPAFWVGESIDEFIY